MTSAEQYRGFPWVWGVAAVLVTLELAPAGRYGMSHDEFYFIACAARLDLGYVDHPPLVAVLTRLARAVFGESLVGLRLLPALAGAGTVLASAATARALGGGAFARTLAAVCVAASLILVAMFNVMTMNAFDILFVSWCAWLLARLFDDAPAHHWLWLGLLAGLGLQNKLTMLVFGFAAFAALAVTGQRRRLATRWPWLSAAVAGAVFLPHVWWQWTHGWPTLEFVRSVQAHRNPAFSPLALLGQLALVANPVTAPLWAGGLLWLLLGPRGPRRALGVVALAFLGVYASQNSQVYYVAPILPLLYAAGAVAVERTSERLPGASVRWRAVVLAPVALSALALAPLAIPLLPVDRFLAYSGRIGLIERVDMHSTRRLPVYFASRFGWPELVDTVTKVWERLPAGDRERCVVLGKDYAKASAINLLGRASGLPRAYSGHNSCWYWGPGPGEGEVAIAIGFGESFLQTIYASVEQVAVVEHEHSHPWQTEQRVYVCREPKVPLDRAWPRFRRFG